MPFLCNACSEVIGTSCGIHEHVATRHFGLSLCQCFYCHDAGHELYFHNYDDLAKHSAIKHVNLQCKAAYFRSIEDENKLYAFILKHINEIGHDQVTTSHKTFSSPVGKQEVIADVKHETSCGPIQKNDGGVDIIDLTDDDVDLETSQKDVSSPVGKQEEIADVKHETSIGSVQKNDGRVDIIDLTDDYVDLEVIPVIQSCVEDRRDNTMQTFDSALVQENNESIVRPVPFQSNQVNIENVVAVPVNTVVLENRNVVEYASVVVKTETSPHLASGQIVPNNQEPVVQDSVDTIETFPIRHNEETVTDQSMADNQSSVAPAMEMPLSVLPPSCNDLASVQNDSSEISILSDNLPDAQVNEVNENMAAVPVQTVIRNDVDCMSVTVKTETSPLACEQEPSDNQVPMQDQMDTGETFPIGHNEETVINQSNAHNQSSAAPEIPSSVVLPSCNDLASVQNETNSEVNILLVKMKKGKAKSNPIIIKEEVPTSPKLNVPKKVQKRAQRRVTSKKRYPCSVCSKRFCDLRMAREHKRVIHDHGEKHKCDQCGKSYSYITHYQTHIQGHKKGMLICDDCGKETAFHGDLKKHIVIKHLKIQAYKCKLCDKTFGLKSNMKKHLNAVHLKEKFVCDYCDRALVTKQCLYKHWKRYHY